MARRTRNIPGPERFPYAGIREAMRMLRTGGELTAKQEKLIRDALESTETVEALRLWVGQGVSPSVHSLQSQYGYTRGKAQSTVKLFEEMGFLKAQKGARNLRLTADGRDFFDDVRVQEAIRKDMRAQASRPALPRGTGQGPTVVHTQSPEEIASEARRARARARVEAGARVGAAPPPPPLTRTESGAIPLGGNVPPPPPSSSVAGGGGAAAGGKRSLLRTAGKTAVRVGIPLTVGMLLYDALVSPGRRERSGRAAELADQARALDLARVTSSEMSTERTLDRYDEFGRALGARGQIALNRHERLADALTQGQEENLQRLSAAHRPDPDEVLRFLSMI